ncbi:hypothetical protein SPBR_00155 [Sporothrix brasiliensis 5110]|uniref:Ima1 N-terminal domain-containing protein n=1 Tax=Sporothrix brasiliensis 5110 TaxID=1398154 RepID=A0A0C2J0U0_9PEZI|nr:uncharacterized protein SPBR_00155 [Sporothrix brasiliensis 5110]KIH90772.1 hypothetical protein SPBR_00155 [Sporothrix brasiliensis 5110]
MVRLRRARYLSCFYCGRRSSNVYDSSVRQFTCSSCDATNYLDENGDITDPPTSTTAVAETTSPFFASGPEPFHDSFGSPGSASSNGGGYGSPSLGNGDQSGVFCKTCLKNQHLFISSLAQYFPSDPNHPDTPELERKYFRFRQGLEQRYPQVCADCEPRVLDRIRDAGYTAKTDHLRRMVDYSRQVRLTRATPLDASNWLGRRLWWAGLLLQMLWQAGVLGSFLLPVASLPSTDDLGFDSDAVVGDSAASQTASRRPAVVLVEPLLRLLVCNTGFLRSACIAATLASCWWNPFFVQTVRGFTKPLIGIPTWYVHQATIVLVRLLLAKVADYQGPLAPFSSGADGNAETPALPPAVAGVHAVAAFFILYLYTVAPRAIRKDVRPLFAKLPETPLTPQRASVRAAEEQQQHQLHISENRRRGLDTLSDVLDEISATPQRPTPKMQQSSPLARRDGGTSGWDGWRPSQESHALPQEHSQNGFGSRGGWPAGARGDPGSAPSQPWPREQQAYGQAAADVDEMDWTPTQPSSHGHTPAQSPHRAFNTYEPGASQFSQGPSQSSAGAFSQTPVEADRGPFWYKVPPAPTSIAQRIFNRPNAPRLVQKVALGDSGDGAGAGTGADASFGQNSQHGDSAHGRRGGTLDLGFQGPRGTSSSVEFAQPSFFAEDIVPKNANKGMAGRGGREGADNDDPGSYLSDLFSQTFTLGAGGATEEGPGDPGDPGDAALSSGGDGRQRASLHRRRPASSATSTPTDHHAVLGRAASLLTTLASLAAVYCLQDIAGGGATSAHSGSGSGSVSSTDALVVQYIQPYARLVETSTVGLCAVLALSRTTESVTRWRRASHRGGGGGGGGGGLGQGSDLAALVGLCLGLASLVLAAWMATQMWTMLQAGQTLVVQTTSGEDAEYNGETYEETHGWRDNSGSAEPQTRRLALGPTLLWPWWQLASLHGTVLAHQAWNMLVQY